MKPPTASSSGRRTSQAASRSKPEVAAFIAALLRQADHAADLVIAFFRAIGMAGPNGHLDLVLPPQFLLKLGAYLQLREWHDAGVIQWSHPEGLTIEDIIVAAIEGLKHGPQALADSQHGTEAMTNMFRTWHETCSPVAREHLNCDVAIEWDCDQGIDEIVETLAEFVWLHRHYA
jgi:hypothetical protein